MEGYNDQRVFKFNCLSRSIFMAAGKAYMTSDLVLVHCKGWMANSSIWKP
jgi:hypothetical protein